MLFNVVALLAISASVAAHPRAPRHRHHFKPSGSGVVAAPTGGGKYGMGNSTSPLGPTGTGYGTGYDTGYGTGIAVPTSVAAVPDLSADTAIDAASDVSGCTVDSESTTTIYQTDLVTVTVTALHTATVATSTASVSVPYSNTTVTVATEADTTTPAVARSDTVPEESSVDAVGTGAAETSAAAPSDLSVAPTPSLATSSALSTAAAETPAEAPAETPAPAPSDSSVAPTPPIAASSTSSTESAETTKSPAENSVASYSSSTAIEPGAFYQVSVATPEPSAAPASSSTRSTGGPQSGKRGLAYNSAALTNAFAGTSMAWAYNWAANPSGTLGSGIEYVPMLWGEKVFGGWDAAAKAALANGATHLLSFNEPDLGEQASMNAATAAAAHIKHLNPYASQAKIGSPAVTNGGPSGGTDGMGLAWLQKFFDRCSGNCKVDFLAFHWYDSANNVAYFKNHVQSAIDLAKKNGVNKVWLTEFGAAGSEAEVAKFLAAVLPWLDSNEAVERYAYFMCSDGKLINGNAISDPVGKAYTA